MKLGVSSYSFHRMVRSGQMSLLDVISKAKEMGFDVIEFSTFILPEGETPVSFAPKIREECERVGIEVANYTIAGDFINGCGGDLDAEIERLKEEVRVAQILGSPGMRHDAAWGFTEDYKGVRSFDAVLPRLAKGCRAVTEYAQELGIRTMVENHGRFAQDSDRIEKLVTAVDHPNFGVLVDMGNFLCVDEAPEKAVGRLMPHAFHVHAKDFHVKSGNEPNPGKGWFETRGGNYLRGAVIGHGNVPILQCLKVMKNNNYNGVLSIEFEGIEDPLTGIEIGFENLKSYVEQVFKD